MSYKLIEEFRGLFFHKKYVHRDSTLGDHVAAYLYEDLFDLGRSPKYVSAVANKSRVLNTKNLAVGKKSRRGDGTFGERVPHIVAVVAPNHSLSFGEVATIEIGAEVKILAKAMRKQLGRVCTDLKDQVAEFKKHGGTPICVGIVGINQAPAYESVEKRRVWKTDGTSKYPHPAQEAKGIEMEIVSRVGALFDELVILRFSATNKRPFDFQWANQAQTEKEYASALIRISRTYESRF